MFRDTPADPCDPCCALSPCRSASMNTPHVSGSHTPDSCPGETCAGSTLSSKPGPAGLVLDQLRGFLHGAWGLQVLCVHGVGLTRARPACPPRVSEGTLPAPSELPGLSPSLNSLWQWGFAAAQLHCQDPAGCHSRPLSGASPVQELKSALPSSPHPAAPPNLSMQYPHRKPIL